MSNSDNGERKSFWETLPGIITAITGTLAAVAALITALNSAGFFHSPKDSGPQSPYSTDTPSTTHGVATTSGQTQLPSDSKTPNQSTQQPDEKKPSEQSQAPNENKSPAQRQPAVFSTGTSLTIRGTWSCDLDNGTESSTGADFFWEQVDANQRYLTPRGGALFKVIGIRDFNSISYDDLTKFDYSSDKIDARNDTGNTIPQGTVLAVKTSEGRYSKFQITSYGYNLVISWVTYSGP